MTSDHHRGSLLASFSFEYVLIYIQCLKDSLKGVRSDENALDR